MSQLFRSCDNNKNAKYLQVLISKLGIFARICSTMYGLSGICKSQALPLTSRGSGLICCSLGIFS